MAGDYDFVCLLANSGSSLSFLSKQHWQLSPMRSELASALSAKGIHVPLTDGAKPGVDAHAAQYDFDQDFDEADFQQDMLDQGDDFDMEA
jgi:hypothetical protein